MEDYVGPEVRSAGFPAAVVKNLDINQDGSLGKGLPMEFFGADVLEALDIGATEHAQ